ncbi:hypothetical protein GALL_476750 [mine drainage metagenome]|uniref:Uncharacterized protein n=1 Tax=mine drainage metagenome TaxID=410659 RepID=A0A1J5Q4C1_9ZZZZ
MDAEAQVRKFGEIRELIGFQLAASQPQQLLHLLGPPRLHRRIDPAEPGIDQLWIDRECAVEALPSLLDPALLHGHNAEVVVEQRISRRQCERVSKKMLGILQIAELLAAEGRLDRGIDRALSLIRAHLEFR